MFDTDPPLSLEEYTTNLSEAAAKRKLDPVIGREKEIERVIQILARRSKNNPVLIGEPGVGKTAVAEGLALRIFDKVVPSDLEDKQIVCLDIGLLLAGTKYRGEFEERIKRIVEEVEEVKNIILVIDEVHTIIGAGAAEGAVDAANILKPALARGQFQCIGATTIEEYRKYIEKDPALERRFQPVYVDEPSVEDTIEILRGIRQYYEHHHRLRISDEAIESAAKYASQYITDRFLPDKAIDLIDEASSRVRLKRGYKLPDVIDALYKEAAAYFDKKTEAARDDRYEDAIGARDKEMEIRAQIRAIIETNKKFSEQFGELLEAPSVEADDIGHIVASWTGIPITKISQSETEKLVNMEGILHQRIIGQEQAVTAISKAIRRARTGLKNPNRPIASFIFSGPTGVGKTELTKTLSSYYFGAEDAMVRLDMSEFMERHTVAKLIGSPPGYVGFSEGGQLTEAVRRKPYTLVLFDEIEKAHPDVFNLLLQILEDGRLTDSKGRTIDFKNTIVIMTSNLGSKVIENFTPSDGVGFADLKDSLNPGDTEKDASYVEMSSLVQKELKNHFRPEFLNRIDEIIVFQQLTKPQVSDIADLMIADVIKRVKAAGFKDLTVTERMKQKLVDDGYNPTYGARPLRRAVTRLLEDSLAKRILDNHENNPKFSEIWADIDERGEPSIQVETIIPEVEEEENKPEITATTDTSEWVSEKISEELDKELDEQLDEQVRDDLNQALNQEINKNYKKELEKQGKAYGKEQEEQGKKYGEDLADKFGKELDETYTPSVIELSPNRRIELLKVIENERLKRRVRLEEEGKDPENSADDLTLNEGLNGEEIADSIADSTIDSLAPLTREEMELIFDENADQEQVYQLKGWQSILRDLGIEIVIDLDNDLNNDNNNDNNNNKE